MEHAVSVRSARTVILALGEAGHEVRPIGVAPDGCWLGEEATSAALSSGAAQLSSPGGSPLATLSALQEVDPVVVFPVIHGTFGEDGTFQGLCEMLDLAYVGAGVTTSAVGMDKYICKRLLAAAGLPVVEDESTTAGELEQDPEGFIARTERLSLPLFAKPRIGGSSVGVRRVDDRSQLLEAVRFALRFDDGVLVEEGIVGRELECAVLGYREMGEIEASRPGEIVPGNEFYDYEDKYLMDGAGLHAPAELSADKEAELRGLAIAGFAALGGWGMARVDFLQDTDGKLYLNEINTLPGFTSISMYPRLWGVSGKSLPELVDRLVEIAVARHRDRHAMDRGIRDWLTELAG